MSVITDFFDRLRQEGGSGNFLIINLHEGAYIQFAVNKGSNDIYCETSGKDYISNAALNLNQTSALNQLGWDENASDFPNNFGQNITFNEAYSPSELEELIHATANIYGVSESSYTYELVLE